MDRGLNLEALTEEDDEESWGRSDSESGDDEEGRSGEPNQFDNLCDGVHACMALVHASLHEMLELKDELLRHTLPPSVLAKTALVTSKVFRSFSDMHVPVGELIRMVRLYSTPWEEKSTALKKLHDDYEGKKTQLNIAIKRLEMIDAHSKRIARERRVMNWEKLFAKLTAAKGHGRRWKFLIDAFKKRANLGMEQLQEYLDSIDISSSEDEDGEEEEEEVTTQMQHVGMGSPSINQEEEEDEDEDAPSSASDSSSEDEVESKDMKDSEVVSEIESAPTHKEEEVRKVVQIKPPMKDAEVWADKPQYDKQLYIRVYSPEGLDCRELKCVLNLGDTMSKTGVLDMHHEEETEAKLAPPKEEKAPSRTPTTPKRGGRGRGLMPGRGGRSTVSPSKTPTLQMAPLPENEEDDENEENDKRYYEDCVFDLEEETPEGQWVPSGSQRVKWPEHLRVAVHFGPREEIVAMATINMADIQKLEPPVVVIPASIGEEFDPEKAIEEEIERAEKAAKAASAENVINEVERANTRASDPRSDNFDETSEDVEIKKIQEEENEEAAKLTKKPRDPEIEKALSQVIGARKSVDFPLYSIHSGRSDAVHVPCGQLPLLCFWVERERPTKLSKMTESESVNALVLDLTGIDLNVTTKEDLNKEMTDEALSTISFTPEPKEETVSREMYDRLMSGHNEEMEMMQNEYEQRLQELMETIQQLQEAQIEMSALAALPQAMVADPTQPPPPPPPHHHPYSRSPAARSVTPQRAASLSPYDARQSIPEMATLPANKHTETDPYIETPPTLQPQPRVGKPLPRWGKGLSEDFFERLQHFNELSVQKKAELREQLVNQMRSDLEKKMASQYRLASKHEEGIFDAIQDVSLPAVFLPSKSNNMQIYNPRAAKYFHPTGSSGARLSQAPSMVQLPPLPKSKISVLNLFDVSQNFHRDGPEWLMQRYLTTSTAGTGVNVTSRQDTAFKEGPEKDGLEVPQRQQTPQNQQQQEQQMQQQVQTQQTQASQAPGSSLSRHSKQSPPAQSPPVKSGRQSNSGSKRSRSSVASFRQERVSAASVRHGVTLPGNTAASVTSQSPANSGGGSRQQQRSVMSANLNESIVKSVSPLDYVPPRTAATMSTTPGVMRTPNPVGVQEVGIVGPVPPPPVPEMPSPVF